MLLWRLTSIILKIEAPRPAADVRKPERSEWAAKSLWVKRQDRQFVRDEIRVAASFIFRAGFPGLEQSGLWRTG